MGDRKYKMPRNKHLVRRVLPGNGPLLDRIKFNNHKLGQMLKAIRTSPDESSVQVRYFLNEL